MPPTCHSAPQPLGPSAPRPLGLLILMLSLSAPHVSAFVLNPSALSPNRQFSGLALNQLRSYRAEGLGVKFPGHRAECSGVRTQGSSSESRGLRMQLNRLGGAERLRGRGAENGPFSSQPFSLSNSQPLSSSRPFGGSTQVGAGGFNLDTLGNDALVFLTASVVIVPICKKLKISPVLGFLLAGLVLGPAGVGVLKDLSDLDSVGEIGILFLLFEQGLELSLDRLKKLAKYAFGLGTLQVVLCTAAFTAVPFFGGSEILEALFGAKPSLVEISRFDESFVIGAALSLSSSAFILKILQEKNQLGSEYGRASLGVLLLQDIAVVPVLVLLPIVEAAKSGGGSSLDLVDLAKLMTEAIAGIGGLLAFGQLVLPRLFGLVAGTRSNETFVALCLLTVAAAGSFTQSIGLSDTLGAFIAGILLAETNYRTQVEADIMPFRGLLLGLFFVTTGASVDPKILVAEWPTTLGVLCGLIGVKAIITTSLSRAFSLSPGDSVRTGFLMSGGGEFAFVVLTLARNLEVLPFQLSKVLSGVVVLSMALTPALSTAGDQLALMVERRETQANGGATPNPAQQDKNREAKELEGIRTDGVVLICGFGPVGQTMASLLSSPIVKDQDIDGSYVAFDLSPSRVEEATRAGLPVFYGDGSQSSVLQAAGVVEPKAIAVTYSEFGSRLTAVRKLRERFPGVPILSRGGSMAEVYALQTAGASEVIPELSEVSIRLGDALLRQFGCMEDARQLAKDNLRAELAYRANVAVEELNILDANIGEKNMAQATVKTFSVYSDPSESLIPHRASTATDRFLTTSQIGSLFNRIDLNSDQKLQPSELCQIFLEFGFSKADAQGKVAAIFSDACKLEGSQLSSTINDSFEQLSEVEGLEYSQFAELVVPILVEQLGVNVCLISDDELFNRDPSASNPK